MMASHISLGKLGEDLACKYLSQNGYRIIERNYRKPYGEIDIIAQAKNGTLVFCEVKTLSSVNQDLLTPEDHMTASKLRKLQKTAQVFTRENPRFVREDRGSRIDLLAVEMRNSASSIRHYENL